MAPLYMDKDGSSRVKLDEEAVTAMVSRCKHAGRLEAGGILVGSYSEDGIVAHVNEALGPPDGSRFTPTGFIRNCAGLSEALQRRWTVQQYYLGEWHFHPRGRSGPSLQDRRQMAEIGGDSAYCCTRPILVVIGGGAGNWKVGVWTLADTRLLPLREMDNDALR